MESPWISYRLQQIRVQRRTPQVNIEPARSYTHGNVIPVIRTNVATPEWENELLEH